jgi:hypothetical protein
MKPVNRNKTKRSQLKIYPVHPRLIPKSDSHTIQFLSARRRFPFLGLQSTLMVLLLLVIQVSHAEAQGSYFWSQQQKIPEYRASTEEPPYLIADMNHTVHAFNSQPLNLENPDSPISVFYRQWTLKNGWTYPNDILFDIDGNALNLLGVTNDQSGQVHLIVLRNGAIYYTQNYLANAGNAASWLVPALIAEGAAGYGPGFEIIAAIAADPQGNEIVVIYGGQRDGKGLYSTMSSDGGGSWSDPYPIYLTGDETMVITDPKLFVGETGLFHAVWTTFLDDGNGGPGFYANFDPETFSWSEPLELDEPGIRTPSVIETNGDVFVSYYHHNVNGNWWRRSRDNGVTWTLPEQFSPRHIGTNGAVSFAVDSGNVLHAFFGERIDDNNHGMWHVTFTGSNWTNIEAVVRGPQQRGGTAGNGFDPRSARAVIVNGNTALVTWGTDGFAGTNGAWYSYKKLDMPELPSMDLESPTLIPRSTSTIPSNTPIISSIGTAANNPEIHLDEPGAAPNPQISIFAGVIPVLALVFGMIVLYYVVQAKK